MPLDTLKCVKKVIGIKQAAKAVEKDAVAMVYVAEDADSRVITPLCELCSRKSIAVEMTPTMLELGKACGIEVGAAAVAVLR